MVRPSRSDVLGDIQSDQHKWRQRFYQVLDGFTVLNWVGDSVDIEVPISYSLSNGKKVATGVNNVFATINIGGDKWLITAIWSEKAE